MRSVSCLGSRNCVSHRPVVDCVPKSRLGNEHETLILSTGIRNPLDTVFSLKGLEMISYFMSKMMGYLIVLGSVVMKLPQILSIVRSRSVIGLNVHSFYFECAENIPAVIYNIAHVPPFLQAYG